MHGFLHGEAGPSATLDPCRIAVAQYSGDNRICSDPLPAMNLRSLQTRILSLFVLLTVVVQAGGFVLINTVGITAARKTASEELNAGGLVFTRLLKQETHRLVQGARLLSADYAFREVIGTGDPETINSALANHGKRIDADVMMLIGMDQRVAADAFGDTAGQPFPFKQLLDKAQAAQQASAMVLLRERLYELVIVPVMAPLPIAWVAVGFNVDDALARDLQRLTRLEVSFLSRQGEHAWRLQASTLLESEPTTRVVLVYGNRFAQADTDSGVVTSDMAVTRLLRMPSREGEAVLAVLQEPLGVVLEPFRRLQRQLALISLLAIAVSIIASLMIARGIARPVRELARDGAGGHQNVPR